MAAAARWAIPASIWKWAMKPSWNAPIATSALCSKRDAASSLSALKKGDHLYLVDGSGYLFRAYHALPPLTRKSDGLPVGAVSGYCNMLWKLLEDMKGGDAPTHLAVIFDAGEKTFRNDHLQGIQGQPPAAAGRPDPAIPPGARRHARFRRRLASKWPATKPTT